MFHPANAGCCNKMCPLSSHGIAAFVHFSLTCAGAANAASAGAQAAPGADPHPQRGPARDPPAAPATLHADSRSSVFFETAEAEGARDPMLLHHLEEMLDKFGE